MMIRLLVGILLVSTQALAREKYRRVAARCSDPMNHESISALCFPETGERLAGTRCCKTGLDEGGRSKTDCISLCPRGTSDIMIFKTAEDLCAANGTRLCHPHEIENINPATNRSVCCGTGCKFDLQYVWTTERCDPSTQGSVNSRDDVPSPTHDSDPTDNTPYPAYHGHRPPTYHTSRYNDPSPPADYSDSTPARYGSPSTVHHSTPTPSRYDNSSPSFGDHGSPAVLATLSCNERMTGVISPNHGVSGRDVGGAILAVIKIVIDQQNVSRVTLSTCDADTDVDTSLFVFDDASLDLHRHLVKDNDYIRSCTVDLDFNGAERRWQNQTTFWVQVKDYFDPHDEMQRGKFALKFECDSRTPQVWSSPLENQKVAQSCELIVEELEACKMLLNITGGRPNQPLDSMVAAMKKIEDLEENSEMLATRVRLANARVVQLTEKLAELERPVEVQTGDSA